MPGMTDLDEMLRTLTISVRDEQYTFVSVPLDQRPNLGDGIEAVIGEAEGVTIVATLERAAAEDWAVDFVATWLTLDIHSSLDAVGLTAAFSAVLAAASIPCNVLAGFHHDHLLVPAERADDAVRMLTELRDASA